MHDLRRRLEQLKHTRLWRLAAKAGQPYGFSGDQVLDEARRVLALPDDQQREELHHLYAELTPAEVTELDAIRQRYAAILGREQ